MKNVLPRVAARVLLLGGVFLPTFAAGDSPQAPDWYRDSVVNLHIDNHSTPVGQGHSVEELSAMLEGIPVTMIQVSAFGAVGKATFPCDLNPVPDLGDWDTIAVWKQVAGRLNKRFGVYINTRGFDLSRQHPEWTQLNAEGKGKGKNGGLDVCARPTPDGSGCLERIFLPLVEQLASRYRPDGIWVDGDHARTATCYCPGCRAAWNVLTGQVAPPAGAADADWSRWLTFQQERYDEYRRRMADTIHRVQPDCLYTSNHSWRFKSKDPRDPPTWAGTLSGDLSHGAALESTRLSSMHLSAVEDAPYDIMHNINAKDRGLQRVLQQGGLAMASGGAWFLWCSGSTIVLPEAQERVRLCAAYARAREKALGRTESRNPVAVLLSENDWQRKTCGGVEGWYDDVQPQNLALGLQDAGYGVDTVNESILRRRAACYRVIVVMNQKDLAPETFQALRDAADGGATVIVAGEGLRPQSDGEYPQVAQWLGVARGQTSNTPRQVDLGDETAMIRSLVETTCQGAELLMAASDGSPLLTRRPQGQGAVAYLALPLFASPDRPRLAGRIMQRLGFGPAVSVAGEARSEHLVFTFRGKPDLQIVHVTNLASRVRGRRIVPASNEAIDRDPPLPAVELQLPVPAEPQSVRVVPAETKLASHTWKDGVLHVRLEDLDVHAAVLIDGVDGGPAPLLSASTPLAEVAQIGERIELDFETLAPGAPSSAAAGNASAGGKTRLLVTRETAAGGRQSLQFLDDPEAPAPYMPYFYVMPKGLDQGTARVRMSLRVEKDAEVQVELREQQNARQFPVGPSLRFRADGKLSLTGREETLVEYPIGRWFGVEILVPFDGRGTFDLKLEMDTGSDHWIRDLPCRSPKFSQCGWIGVISPGTKPASFYLDNLLVERAAE